MQAFILKLIISTLHIQPATAKSRTVSAALAAIFACLGGAAGAYATGDVSVVHYVAYVAGLCISLGFIFHRDSISKLGALLEKLTATQGQKA